MEFPEAKWSFSQTETYMWGPAFLVHAITDSMAASKEKGYKTNLSTQASWFDFHSGKLVATKKVNSSSMNIQTVNSAKTLQYIPVFVRSGSFVPMSPIIQSTEQYRDSATILHFYIDPNAGAESTSFVWYEDDGATFNAEAKGLAKKLHCAATTQSKSCSLTFTPELGANLWEKYFQFALLVHTPVSPKEVILNGQKVAFKFDKEKQTLQFKGISKLKVSSPQQLELKW
jgi:alpha-glucosidase (family GH31 glycosyl hydrolase)